MAGTAIVQATGAAGCGCCTEEPRSVEDRVAELKARRDALDRRLEKHAPSRVPELAGVGS